MGNNPSITDGMQENEKKYFNEDKFQSLIEHPQMIVMAVFVGGKSKVVSLSSLDTNITSVSHFLQFDIGFDKSMEEGQELWNGLEIYRKSLANEKEKSQFGLYVFPGPENLEYTFIALDPIFWALSSQNTDEKPTKIKVLFDNETVGLFAVEFNDPTKVDLEKSIEQDYYSGEDDFMFEPLDVPDNNIEE